MSVLPQPLQSLIDSFSTLPGVGPRTAERYAYHLLRSSPAKAQELSYTLEQLHDNISYCHKTFALVKTGQKLSPLYTDSRRQKNLVAVVADQFDVVAIEKTNSFRGTYHVLGGLLSPIDGVEPDQLHIKELLKRINDDHVKEFILATNASVEGENTALYISQQISNRSIKVTRLARGLSVGVDLEYADQITLARAFEGRQKV